MGRMEARSAAKMRRTKLHSAVISVIAGAGAIAIGAVAPGVIDALGRTTFLAQYRYRVNSILTRMIMKGYARVEVRNGKRLVTLTPKGEHYAALIHEGRLAPKKPSRWDGKWRLVSYDIQGHEGVLRARVRELLRSWGFILVHQSLWVYPYGCEDLIFLLKKEYRIGKNLLYVIAEEIENDKTLREHFGLPPR